MHREDGKETAQGQVSHRQGSTDEDKRKIVNREDQKQKAQGRVSQGQGSTTGHRKIDMDREKTKGKIENKKHKDEYLRAKIPLPETER